MIEANRSYSICFWGPEAPIAEPDEAPMPVVVETSGADSFISIYEADELDDIAKNNFIAAQECIEEEAFRLGMSARYFYYFMGDPTSNEEVYPYTLEIGEFNDVVVETFIDEEWIQMRVTINPDGTITIEDAVSGPTVIFVSK